MSGEPFRRSARLTKAADFQRVFTQPRRSADPYFTVQAVPNGHGTARLGLAIAKRQVRRAVDRNRLKRLARETFRRQFRELPGIDLVVMARTAATTVDNATLQRALHRHFHRLAAQLAGRASPI